MLNRIIKQPGVLVNTLKYPEITGNPGIKIVITGGRPQLKISKIILLIYFSMVIWIKLYGR
jgi:hypothetical protein